jgi:hypothetical protein
MEELEQKNKKLLEDYKESLQVIIGAIDHDQPHKAKEWAEYDLKVITQNKE